MSDGLNPTGPSQPGSNQVYETQGNPASKNSVEESKAQINSHTDHDNAVAHRGPEQSSSDSATATSRARGIHGAPPGEESKVGGAQTQSEQDEKELDAAQMAAPGEGEINAAVEKKAGASGNEPGLESDLDKKKREQAPARDAMKAKKKNKVDVGGMLEQRGGPAETVGNRN